MPSCRYTNIICAHSLRQTDTLTTVLGKQKLYKIGQSRLMPCSRFLLQGLFGKQISINPPLKPIQIRKILDVQICDSKRRYIQFCTCSEHLSQSINHLYKILHDPSYLCVIFNIKLPGLRGPIPWNTGHGIERSPVCYSSWQLSFHPLGKLNFPLLKILHKQ